MHILLYLFPPPPLDGPIPLRGAAGDDWRREHIITYCCLVSEKTKETSKKPKERGAHSEEVIYILSYMGVAQN